MTTTAPPLVEIRVDSPSPEVTKVALRPCASTSTAPTVCVESSEEFSASGQEADPCTTTVLQLSNMAIVEEQQQQPEESRVRFAADVTVIRDEDIAVVPPPKRKSKSKKSKKEESEEERLEQILPQDLWWSKEELNQIELNATYLVKESQQYQEEVICTVLYNKAFLSAANLGKSLTEEQLSETLQDVTQYSNTLEKWTAVGHSRRGLENMVSEKAVVDAVQSRMSLLAFQKELDSSDTEFLAKRCQDTSRTARILARMMGQADADSLAHAESLCQEAPRLPEPPGRYSGDHEYNTDSQAIHLSPTRRGGRRGSLLKTVGKAVGKVFIRQASKDARDVKRIRKIQQKRWAEEESSAKRPGEEFRRSFLESLDYGEAPGCPKSEPEDKKEDKK